MPAEVVEHCTSTCRKFENEFAHFLAEKLRNLRAERALFQRSTACRPALELRRRLQKIRFAKRNRRKRKREVCAPRAENVVHSWKFFNKFGRRRRNFLCEFDAGRARFRQRTRHRLDATLLRRQKIFITMPAEVVEHCASTCRKFENEFAHFLAGKLRDLRAECMFFKIK